MKLRFNSWVLAVVAAGYVFMPFHCLAQEETDHISESGLSVLEPSSGTDGFSRESVYNATGLPIPRFVSLRSDKVFVRTGPALRYPIKWVFQKEGLPVEVVQEFDTWRKIRDPDGEEGWVHQSLLSGHRSVVVSAEEGITLRKDPLDSARASAVLESGVVASLQSCVSSWCEVSAGGYRGWTQRNFLWGIYADEELD